MKLFKKKKRLEEELDCPDIKWCASKGILYPCNDGGYTDCQYFQARREKKKN